MKMVSGKSSSFKVEHDMSIKIIFGLVFSMSMFLLIPLSETYADLYSGGPWRGRVIDAETKQPIEGAVVAVTWHRVYDCGVGRYPYFQEAREVLTDKTGSFEIPAYVEKRSKSFWRLKDLGDLKAGLICSGPVIREPEFIIYKPLYGNFPDQDELRIFAIGPNPSMVEYQEYYKELIKGQQVIRAKRKTRSFPEGLVYDGKKCQTKIEAFEKTLLFIPMKGAREKVENLAVPLDCPENGEPVPSSMHGFRDDVENQYPVIKGGYIIIELPRLRTKKERIEAVPGPRGEVGRNELPMLYKVIDEEKNYLRSH
jgi:hypothetical protein